MGTFKERLDALATEMLARELSKKTVQDFYDSMLINFEIDEDGADEELMALETNYGMCEVMLVGVNEINNFDQAEAWTTYQEAA